MTNITQELEFIDKWSQQNLIHKKLHQQFFRLKHSLTIH